MNKELVELLERYGLQADVFIEYLYQHGYEIRKTVDNKDEDLI